MTAQASAASVPGRTARCMSAAAAVPVRYGSTTTSLAPRSLRARVTWAMTLTWVDTGLVPHSTFRSATAISRESAPLTRPQPAIHPAVAMVLQMVPLRPDQRIACRSRKMPSRFTSPIVPAEL